MKYNLKTQSKTLATYLIAVATLFTACSRTPDPTPAGPYTNGVFVMNFGNFNQNNGSLSWLTRTGSTAETNIFETRNRRPIRGGIQSYVEAGNRGIILVDNSAAGADKIEIVTADSLRAVKTLGAPDIENPRYAVRISDTKAYVTCWGTTGTFPNYYVNPGYVAVIDLITNTVTKKIPVQKGAEGITVVGNEAYIASTDFSGSNMLTVIDTQTDVVKQQILLTEDVNKLQVDADNKLWAFAGKNAIRINPFTKSIEATIPVGLASNARNPGNLTPSADRRSMYYTYTNTDAAFRAVGQVYRFGIADAAITPTMPVINRSFIGITGLGFDPKANVIYTGVTPSLAQAGLVYRYQATGQLVDSVKVEISPVGFFFK